MNNKVFIAAAGSGKTTYLVRKALAMPTERILITTYTEDNAAEIKKKFIDENKCVPSNVNIIPWFSFLLRDGVRPYQGMYYKRRIAGIKLVNGQSAKKIPESNFRYHYLSDSETIYSDKVSKLVCHIDDKSNGAVISRLEKMYSHIFIDEIQDLAGYDLDFLKLIFASALNTILVGDPRQGTFVTNNSSKNKKYARSNIENFFNDPSVKAMVEYDTTTLNVNYRCVQSICDFANSIFPEMSPANSGCTVTDYHLGVCFVKPQDVEEYIEEFHPVILRYNKNTPVSPSAKAINFGKAKGRTFERVLIYPTKTITDWILFSKEMALETRSKFYVAITRPRLSVGIVCNPGDHNLHNIPIYTPLF